MENQRKSVLGLARKLASCLVAGASVFGGTGCAKSYEIRDIPNLEQAIEEREPQNTAFAPIMDGDLTKVNNLLIAKFDYEGIRRAHIEDEEGNTMFNLKTEEEIRKKAPKYDLNINLGNSTRTGINGGGMWAVIDFSENKLDPNKDYFLHVENENGTGRTVAEVFGEYKGIRRARLSRKDNDLHIQFNSFDDIKRLYLTNREGKKVFDIRRSYFKDRKKLSDADIIIHMQKLGLNTNDYYYLNIETENTFPNIFDKDLGLSGGKIKVGEVRDN